mmetsp:Transcript_41326/g.74497  ORF Transcript_41326/g.74497 Transcript_41326/m.74497 type:complete len:308 (-) Transcript_41326:138-1061(-)|eukprot:CAMPEP_0201915144 /NCGR_PEP_ID=MMETSP0903-20130614/5143_1 /ASSEMBLY_ACC=CAM_ASM_000552 /TAXON_ID=420261 /ORGANISM="Thalassiosira antarctica, Strain CCMP982" /LENGTH=307 /DNA_ID=CAMNT_0048450697 /DNA_START=157 /DNA_END=1083 /DNA_ORIENTATION=-
MKASIAVDSLPRLLALVTAGIMMAIPSSSFVSNLMHNNNYPHINIIRGQRMPSPSSCSIQMSTTLQNNNDYDELTKQFSLLRSLGVDYGLTRTGVAITSGGYRPRPLTIIKELNATQLATDIVNYFISEQATNIVLGLPLHKNGTASQQSRITRMFGELLLTEVRSRCGSQVEVMLWDERYTSKEAAARIAAEAMARNQPIPSASDLNEELDADAACIILEDYYKELGVDAERVVFENAAVAEECEEVYKQNLEREGRLRIEQMEERERGRNARREMMERVRALEEENGVVEVGGGKKKKKKKKKKK